MRIDSHHHLWKYSAVEYPWIGEGMDVLKTDFLFPQLEELAAKTGVQGFVTVQARQSLEETGWLLELADGAPLIQGVVGWVPLAHARELEQSLDQFANHPKLKGVRHVVHDEPDDAFILGSAFNAGIRTLLGTQLLYDILIFGKHLPNTIQFVDQHPKQVFVLDHIAKPTIVGAEYDAEWERQLRELAKRENVFCKFSGVVTEVRDDSWSVDMLKPYWDVAWEAFGDKRLMFGSDWPVCLMRTPYSGWLAAVEELSSQLSSTESIAFWGGNAQRVYGLA